MDEFRRSYYTGRSDVMSPCCQIDGKALHEWLDDEVEFETGDSGTLHDVVVPYLPKWRSHRDTLNRLPVCPERWGIDPELAEI